MKLLRPVLLMAALLPGVPSLEAQMTPAAPVRFTRLSVPDPQMNGIEAVSFLLPSGWKAEGGVQWLHDFSVLANLRMRVLDPASGASLEFLPMQNFTWTQQTVVPIAPGTNYLGNIFHQPLEPVPFVAAFYMPDSLRHLQGARLLGAQDLPAVAQAVSRSLGGQSQVRAARIRYAFGGPGGPWEEDVYLTLTYTQGPGMVLWSVHTAYSFRAPQGSLDRLTPRMATIVSTLRISEAWFAGFSYVQQLFQNRQAGGIRAAGELSATISRNSEEIRRMYSSSYQAAQDSQDRISRGFSEATRSVETFADPSRGREIQLPSGYQEAWVNTRGEYLMSPQAGYDPNQGSDTSWTRLARPGAFPGR